MAESQKSAEQIAAANPANAPRVRVTDDNRIPLVGQRSKLTVPLVEGCVLHWFLDYGGRLDEALRAGWEFVKRGELELRASSIADSSAGADGNSDMGDNISVHGMVDERGQSSRLYLMKIKREWAEADEAAQQELNMTPVNAVRAGAAPISGEGQDDRQRRYGTVGGQPFARKG